MGGTGEPVSASIGGAHGYLYEGEGDGGGYGILWEVGSTCNLVSLELEMPDLPAPEAKEEIIRVANSLQPTGK